MSTDFAPIFEKKFHDKVIPGLLMVLDDNENPRVQAHAGAALVNFSEDCPKVILTPYLNAIMEKLQSILTAKFQELVSSGTKLVLEQVKYKKKTKFKIKRRRRRRKKMNFYKLLNFLTGCYNNCISC